MKTLSTDEESDDGGATDVLALAGEPGVDAGALDAEEHEDRDQHRALGLLEERRQRVVSVATPEVVGENVCLEGDHRDDDEHQDRHDLGDGGDPVDDRGLFDPAQDQIEEQPHADRRADHRQHGVAGAQRGEQRAGRGHDHHPVRGVARARRRPEPERGVEARRSRRIPPWRRRRYRRPGRACGWPVAERRRPASTFRHRRWSTR